jgi:hypothetical protein
MFAKKQPCPKCQTRIKLDFDFCPHCGCDVRNPEKDLRNYGLLGKNEIMGLPTLGGGGMGITDKLIGTLFNSLMKSFEAHMNSEDVQATPQGITISVGGPRQKAAKVKNRVISEEQIKRMTGLPRVEAKTDVRRLADRVVYELKINDIESVDDIFVSRVESGYEVKAIGKKKIYVNTLPINLPLKGYSLGEKGLVFEFNINQ